MKRRLSVFALIALAGVMYAPINAAPAPYEINVILPSTGPAAFLGGQELKALAVLEKLVNQTGGIKGRPVKFVSVDDQSSPQTAVQLTNAAIGRKLPFVIGSAVASTCSAMAPIASRAGLVEYCLSPIIRPAVGEPVFSASAGSSDIAVVDLRFFREHGWKRIALITATDASGQDFEKQFDAAMALGENRDVKVVAREHFNPADLSVSAQMNIIKQSRAQALTTFATGTSLGTLLRGIHETDLGIPVSASAGNMIYAQIAQYTGFLPKDLYFGATRGVAPDPNLGRGPIKDAQAAYFNAFRAAGMKPDFATSLPWDPTMILVDALRHIGPNATAEQIHAYIEKLHGWAGIDGIYDFPHYPQRGLGANAMQMYRWDAAKTEFVVASKPAGYLK